MKHVRAFLMSLVLLVPSVALAQVHGQGYWRQDGTYVSPHWRTAPDGNPYNNFAAPQGLADLSIYGRLGQGVAPFDPTGSMRDGVGLAQDLEHLRQLQLQNERVRQQLQGGR